MSPSDVIVTDREGEIAMKGPHLPTPVPSTSVTRRTAVRRGVIATAALGGLAAHPSRAQDASPVQTSDIPGTVGTLLSVVATDIPSGPVEVALSRVVAEAGLGDLEDYFTFPGPLAFIVESGTVICRCGTDESPCLHLHADGSNEPAPVIPTDITLGPGEGLYIPTNTPDSFIVPGPEDEVELDLSIFPAEEPTGTPPA
jgi:hypothetical protein